MPDLNWYNSLPKKRMGVGIIFFDQQENILIVKPSYKDHWTLVGGIVEENESLLSAAQREIKEELEINISELKLVCVDYISKEGDKSDNLQFVFFGGKLDDKQVQAFVLPKDELSEFKFVKLEEALNLVSDKLKKRLSSSLDALKSHFFAYLENGMLR